MNLKRIHLARRFAVLGAPLAAAALLIAGCGSGTPAGKQLTGGQLRPGQPVAATVAQLTYYETSVNHPVYWIGPYRGYTYELTETATHNTYIRYLPAGVSVGDPRPQSTTVGTYPTPDAYRTLSAQAKDKGMTEKPVPYDGIAVWSAAHPHNVYLAYPKLEFLIEVYDPSPAHAQAIALSGEMEPVRAAK
jgi:hypothetical protein